jgi:hypothetical protein
MILLLLFLDLLTPNLDNRAVEISHFSFRRNREHHGGVWPDDLDGPPPIGQRLFAMVELLDENEIADIQFWFVDERDRGVIAPLGFLRISERSYCGWATVPSQPFRVRAEGKYLDGKKFHAISALQAPVARTLPPELSGGIADEKARALTASPAPIPIPHVNVVSMRHHLEGNRLRLDFEIEVIGADSAFNFWPRVNGPSRFASNMSPQKLAVGRHHLSFDVAAVERVKPGPFSVGLPPTGWVGEIRLP